MGSNIHRRYRKPTVRVGLWVVRPAGRSDVGHFYSFCSLRWLLVNKSNDSLRHPVWKTGDRHHLRGGLQSPHSCFRVYRCVDHLGGSVLTRRAVSHRTPGSRPFATSYSPPYRLLNTSRRYRLLDTSESKKLTASKEDRSRTCGTFILTVNASRRILPRLRWTIL